MPVQSPAHRNLSRDAESADFLARLARRETIDAPVALVVAHPDDEAIGAGGQIDLLRNLTLVVASDGAPRDARDAKRAGHASVGDYARARRQELGESMGAAGLSEEQLVRLDLPDGELVAALDAIVPILANVFAFSKTEFILTHAYEGGHPDHDAIALAVQIAATRCGRPPLVIEMPFYRAGPYGWILQAFAETGAPPARIHLGETAFARKCAMIDAHRSQARFLQAFRQPIETFRPSAGHDFTHLPNDGHLLYAQVAPHMSGPEWLAYARAACMSHGA